MKIIQSDTADKHLKRLVNTRARQPYADGDLQVSSVTAQTPGAGNSNKNTRLVVAAKSGGKAQGTGTFDYNRIALAAMNPLAPAKVNSTNADNNTTIADKILKQFGIPADQVTIVSPASPPPTGRSRNYTVSPKSDSLLFVPGDRIISVQNVSGATVKVPDNYSFYLSGDGPAEGSQAFENLVDATPLTVTGNTKFTQTQKKYGSGSIYFDGTGDYLTIPRASVGSVLTGDFTIEMWVYPQALTGLRALFAQWSQVNQASEGIIVMLNADKVTLYFASLSLLTSTIGVTANAWNHIAITRQGSNFRIFINGAVAGTVVNTTTRAAIAIDYTMGSYVNASSVFPASGVNDYQGYIDEIGVWVGTAKYTAAFNPQSLTNTTVYPAELKFFMNAENLANNSTDLRNLVTDTLLTRSGDTKVSTAQAKYGAGSIFLDGTGDYLTIPRAEIGNIYTGDFTMEAWVYPTSNGAWRTIMAQWSQQTGNLQYGAIIMINNGTLLGYFAPYSTSTALTGTAVSLNAWSHVALTRQGNTLRLFLNGAVVATATTTNTGAQLACDWTIGNFYGTNGQFPASGSTDFAGYIDQAAIWQGVSRYNAAFTPEPLFF